MKKRKPAARRTRRSPYERSLEYATKRLAKATEEHKDCQLRLEALNREIPYLQTVIRALTPDNKRAVIAPTIFRSIPPVPTTVNVDELPSEEDQFLNVSIPGEKELLP